MLPNLRGTLTTLNNLYSALLQSRGNWGGVCNKRTHDIPNFVHVRKQPKSVRDTAASGQVRSLLALRTKPQTGFEVKF